MSRKSLELILMAALLGLATVLTFLLTLKNGFVSLDDPALVYENSLVRNFNWADALTRTAADDYLPLVFASFALEKKIAGGFDPFVFHLTNLILHTLNIWLAFYLLSSLLNGRTAVAFVSALVFSVHPLHVESVAWISERKDVLSTFFFLSAIGIYLFRQQTWRISRKIVWLTGVSLLFTLALLSKLMAVTLPAILLLVDWLKARPNWKEALLEKTPLFILSGSMIAIHLNLHKPAGHEHWSLLGALENGLSSLAFYIWKTFWPWPLSVFYQRNVVEVHWAQFGFAALIASLVLGFILRTRKKGFEPIESQKLVLFGWAFFLITISPVLQVIPFGNKFVFADRFMYLPSFGLFPALTIQISELLGARRALTLASLVIPIFAYSSFHRSLDWKDSETLWKSALDAYPESSVARNNYAGELLNAGRFDEARSHFLQAISLDPGFADPRVGLGILYSDQGQYELAEKELLQAIALNPGLDRAFFNLGVIADKKGEPVQALEYYRQAVKLAPERAGHYINLGTAYYRLGQKQKSFESFETALALDSDLAEAHNNLAHLFLEENQNGKAVLHFQKALDLDPDFDRARKGLASAHLKMGNQDAAVAELQESQRRLANPQPLRREKRF